VLVYSVNFTDVRADVTLIRSRILVAAGIALVVVLLLGVLVARALTVRVLRLERTAQQVAQGTSRRSSSVDSGDELGQLAGALDHMQSQLRGLEEARRRFIATASHELRTPIFSLGGFLELIQDEELDEETRAQFVGQVREQVDRLGKLATQLLDLSRLESGSVELTRRRPTSACSRGSSPASSCRRSRSTTRSSTCELPEPSRSRERAIPSASRSCCGS
jgi:two-component system OmpR family sensor kinase